MSKKSITLNAKSAAAKALIQELADLLPNSTETGEISATVRFTANTGIEYDQQFTNAMKPLRLLCIALQRMGFQRDGLEQMAADIAAMSEEEWEQAEEALAPAVTEMMERLGKPYIKRVTGRTTYPNIEGEATLS
jgi:hypothetical protein